MIKKLSVFLVLLLLLCCAVPSLAAPALPEGEVDLEVKAAYEGVPLPNTVVTLHRVGEILETSPWITYGLTGSFASYPVDLQELDNAGWAVAAATLASYASADSLPPDYQGTSDENGVVSFSQLPAGLYLMQMANQTDEAGYSYSAAPVLLTLPGYQENTWQMETQAALKIIRVDPPETTQIEVQKIWEAQGMELPDSITVELLCQGELVATAELSEANYWKHTFTQLEVGKEYEVVERNVPDGFTVTISRTDNQVVITNTAQEVPPEPENPDPEIPQTGIIRWPITLVTVLGIVVFAAGWCMYYAGKKET